MGGGGCFFPFLYIYIQRNPSSCQGQLCTWASVCALLLDFMYVGTVAMGCWGCHPKSMTPEEPWNIVLWFFLELILVKQCKIWSVSLSGEIVWTAWADVEFL